MTTLREELTASREELVAIRERLDNVLFSQKAMEKSYNCHIERCHKDMENVRKSVGKNTIFRQAVMWIFTSGVIISTLTFGISFIGIFKTEIKRIVSCLSN